MPGKAGAARNPRAGTRAAAAAQAVKASAAAAAALAVVALGVGRGAAAGQDSAAGVAMQPGQWETVMRVTSFEIAGAPPETQADARSQIGRQETMRDCMTPERARDPLAQMREMMSQGPAANCQFTDQVFAGGVIRIRATCPGLSGQGPGGQMSMEGSFTATTARMTLAISAPPFDSAVPGAIGMRMTADFTTRRVGECPASPAAAPPSRP
jgi:hypothetical protein